MVPCPKLSWTGRPSPASVLPHGAVVHPHWESLAQDCVGFFPKAKLTHPFCMLCSRRRVGSG